MVTRKIVPCIAFVIVMSMFSFVTGCTSGIEPAVTGSGKLRTWDIDYGDFTKIEVGYAFDVDIAKADSYLVRITADEKLYDYLDINRRGDTLFIALEPKYNYVNIALKATIHLPDLHKLRLSGASKARVRGFSSSHSMDFDLSGASYLDLRDTKAKDTDFTLTGASHVSGSIAMADGSFDLSGASVLELEGSAYDVSIEASGASHAGLADFSLVDTRVNLSGASTATINASGSLDGDLSGGSKLHYVGNPTLGSINVSGGSTISRK
jgi:hypothetical protein